MLSQDCLVPRLLLLSLQMQSLMLKGRVLLFLNMLHVFQLLRLRLLRRHREHLLGRLLRPSLL